MRLAGGERLTPFGMDNPTHALRRTSPKGGPFVGYCYRCGARGLSSAAALEWCPNDLGMTNAEAVLAALDPADDNP